MRNELSRPRGRWVYPAISAGFFTLVFVLILVRIWQRNGHHFVYALDDTYIHLALSKGIAQGYYGINAGEPSSPSSSLLWPFLLALFARWRYQVYVPLALDFCFGALAALLAGGMVARWPEQGRASGGGDRPQRVLASVALVLIGNLVGLAFLGMEHSLEVLLAGMVAWGITDCLRERGPAWWAVGAALLLPSVRYEGLGVTVALAIALAGLRRYKSAGLLVLSVVPLVGFGVFLHRHGLPLLPVSVLMKGGLAGAGHDALRQWAENLAGSLRTSQPMWVLAVSAAALGALAWSERLRARRFAFAGAGVAVMLHLLLGHYGWMARYEVYIVFFAALVLLYNVHERPAMQTGWYALGLLCCAQAYVAVLPQTAAASGEIYRQQYQTSRFLTDYYGGNVAVGDLGVVAYRRRPEQYVLDLGGLGSAEVALARERSPQWMASVLHEHKIGVVAVYAVPPYLPPEGWEAFGKVCLAGPVVVAFLPCVSYFAPAPEAVALRARFQQFLPTLPDSEYGTVVGPEEGADWRR